MQVSDFFQRLGAHAETGQAQIHDSQRSISYGELLAQAATLSDWLRQQGIQRLGLLGGNSIEWLIADLAALQAGVTLVPIPEFFHPNQQATVVAAAQLHHLLSEQRHAWPAWSQQQRSPSGWWLLHDGQPSAAADSSKITFTSGSTSAPKGVRLAAETMLQTVASVAQVLPAELAQRHLCVLPLSVLLENIAGAWLALYLGMDIHVPALHSLGFNGNSALAIETFWQALAKHQPDSLITTPALAQAVLSGVQQQVLRVEQFRFIAVGGAAVPPVLLRQAEALGLPLYEGYGLSECAAVVCLNTPQARRPGSVGQVLPGVQLRIVDGEIQLRGKAMLGYLGAAPIASDDWLSSGDLGSLDADGFLYLQGRRSNLLITSYGRNVSPEWPESLAVGQAEWSQLMVCGDGLPALVALITVRPGVSAAQVSEALARLNQQLPEFARIQHWLPTRAPFSVDNQQLTFNQRFRRAAIVAAYEDEIHQLVGVSV